MTKRTSNYQPETPETAGARTGRTSYSLRIERTFMEKATEAMTPLHLMMLLHYHAVCGEPYAVREPYHRYSPAVCEYRNELFRRGLIKPVVVRGNSVVDDNARWAKLLKQTSLVNFDHGLFTTTKRGAELIQILCNLGGMTYGEQSKTVSE